VKGLTEAEYDLLQACLRPCISCGTGPEDLGYPPESVVEALVAAGRAAPVLCEIEPEYSHPRPTAAGLAAMRIYEALRALTNP
jgi:hypothetical protein